MEYFARVASLASAVLVVLGCEPTPFREVAIDLESSRASAEPTPRSKDGVLRIAVAEMESPQDTYLDYVHLFAEVAARLDRRVELVQRRTYDEVNDLLESGAIDAALLCTGGYLDLTARAPSAVEMLGVPIIEGSDTYGALLIVPASSPAKSLADLRGKRFAFTDGLSLTGRAWVLHRLREMGEPRDAFFGSVIYTHGHDRSITAVARQLVDGASVHAVVLRHALVHEPSIGARIRVLERSEPFGSTPFVASTRALTPAERARLRTTLLALHEDAAGETVLHAARIDRFEAPDPKLYASARQVMERAR